MTYDVHMESQTVKSTVPYLHFTVQYMTALSSLTKNVQQVTITSLLLLLLCKIVPQLENSKPLSSILSEWILLLYNSNPVC